MNNELMSVLNDINKIVIPSVGLLGIISSSIAAVIALLQIRLKTKEQTTTLINKNIESEIKLLKVFTEIMEIAHAYGETEISKELIEHIIGKIKNIDDDQERTRILKIIKETVFLTKPKGKAAQDAAIAAIYTLGINNKVLFEPALQGLESLSKFTDSGKKYYELIKREQTIKSYTKTNK